MLKTTARQAGAGKNKDTPPVLPPEKFEVLVTCEDEAYPRRGAVPLPTVW
jgi:hypothetical protein